MARPGIAIYSLISPTSEMNDMAGRCGGMQHCQNSQSPSRSRSSRGPAASCREWASQCAAHMYAPMRGAQPVEVSARKSSAVLASLVSRCSSLRSTSCTSQTHRCRRCQAHSLSDSQKDMPQVCMTPLHQPPMLEDLPSEACHWPVIKHCVHSTAASAKLAASPDAWQTFPINQRYRWRYVTCISHTRCRLSHPLYPSSLEGATNFNSHHTSCPACRGVPS